MSSNLPTENRRAGLTPREAIFVDVVRDGLRRAYRAAERVNRKYRGRLSVQPSLSTTYIRHYTDKGKAYDFDAADLYCLPEIYFFISAIPFVTSDPDPVDAVADVGNTITDMVRLIERVIEKDEMVVTIEQNRAARCKDARSPSEGAS